MLIDAGIAEIHALLRDHRVLLAHFSGTPKGVGSKTHFPNDLHYACAHDATTPLACSTVGPSDLFGDKRARCATGSVGLVLAGRRPESIMCVTEKDAGSPLERLDRPTKLVECHESIVGRVEGYNEWNVVDYEVLGVLLVPPMTVDEGGGETVEGADDTPSWLFGDNPPYKYREIDVQEVARTFPGRRLFTFQDDNLCEWRSGDWTPIGFDEVYSGRV